MKNVAHKNPFEIGHYTPEQARHDRAIHQRKEDENVGIRLFEQKKNLPSKLLNAHNVTEYLQQEHLTKDVGGEFGNVWKVEPVLLRELQENIRAKSEFESLGHGAHPDIEWKRDFLRALVRAQSSISYDHRIASHAKDVVDADIRFTYHTLLDQVDAALASGQHGAELEPFVQDLEDVYIKLMAKWQHADDEAARAHYAKQIASLRPLRDQLYLYRVHDTYAMRHHHLRRPGN